MPKIDFAFTRTIRQTATHSVEISDDDFARIRADKNALKAWALFGVANQIRADEWKPATFADQRPEPAHDFTALVDGVDINAVEAARPLSPMKDVPPEWNWSGTRGTPIVVEGYTFHPYRTGIDQYTRYCPELKARVGRDRIGSNKFYVVIDGKTLMNADGKPRGFIGEKTAFETAVRMARK
jgi:hypothetical protein